MITNIQQIKAAANISEIIGAHITLKRKGTNMVGLCPFHNEKTPSFTVNQAKGIYKCFGCGKSGDVIDFLMEHKGMNYIQAITELSKLTNIPLEEQASKYTRPEPRLEKLSPEYIAYFEKRGISNNTLIRLNVTEATEWMPKAEKPVRTLCFNYYRNEELVNIKYRAKDKDFKLAKDAELIFYNLDALKDETTCVIVEGEIDCLSMHEAGIYNCVSVPNGAGTGQQQLKYLDNCWSAFEGMTKIIIATDNDDPGIRLRDELARRLGKDRCYRVEYPADCKDANDVLLKHTGAGLEMIVATSRPWPIDGVLTMDDLFDKVKEYYEQGYPEGLTCGIGEFDELLQFSGGQFTTVTGSPGSGKSEWIDYLATRLARLHNWKFAVCSFENPPAFHVTKLMEKFSGLSFAYRKDPTQRMSKAEFDESVYQVDQYFQFINIAQADVTIQGILSKLREMVLRIGIKAAIIDPWNYIEHKVPPGYTETQYISESLPLIKEFCVKNDVHLFLVAHPRKLMKDMKTHQYPVATMYDISGSAHFFNKTDNGISVHRDFINNVVTVYVQKVRFSWQGKIGFSTYNFNTMTRQYEQI